MDEISKVLQTNLIEFPKGRSCFFGGKYHRIYGMLIGCCLDDDGHIHTFRIPLEGESREPVGTVGGKSEDIFLLLPEGSVIDEHLFREILQQRRAFDLDNDLTEEIYLLQDKQIRFRKKEVGPFEFTVHENTEKGWYYLTKFPVNFTFEQHQLDVFFGLLFDLAVFQQYTDTKVILEASYKLEDSPEIKRINEILTNIYKNGLFLSDSDNGMFSYDGVNVYSQYFESEPMTLDEFKSGYPDVYERIPACRSAK